MIPTLTLRRDGLFDTSKLTAWTAERQEQIRRGVKKAFAEGGRELARAASDEIRGKMKVSRKQFPSIRAKLFAEKADRLPAMLIGSKIPWLGIHGRGGVVASRGGGLLIPLTPEGRRLGPKAFGRIITELMRQGNAFFKEVNGKVLLFARQESGSSRHLGRFKKSFRQREGFRRGQRLSRAVEIPIAVLVRSVTIRKSFDLSQMVRRGMPGLARKVEQYIVER